MFSFSFLCTFALLAALADVAAGPPRPELDPAALGIPFQRYTTEDSLGRVITFYLSTAPGEPVGAGLPVVLFIQGSGCQSVFRQRGEMVIGGTQNLLLQEAKGRARVLVV